MLHAPHWRIRWRHPISSIMMHSWHTCVAVPICMRAVAAVPLMIIARIHVVHPSRTSCHWVTWVRRIRVPWTRMWSSHRWSIGCSRWRINWICRIRGSSWCWWWMIMRGWGRRRWWRWYFCKWGRRRRYVGWDLGLWNDNWFFNYRWLDLQWYLLECDWGGSYSLDPLWILFFYIGA